MKTRREFLKNAAMGGMAGIIASGVAPAYSKERSMKNGVSLEQAMEVHKRCLIIDGHNDTPVERVARGENPLNWKQRDTAYNTDIPRMKEAGQYVGFFIVGDGPVSNVWATIERVLAQIEAYPKDLMPVLSSKDAVHAGKTGKIGVLMAIEGAGRWLEGRLETLHVFYRLGIRAVGITHGEGGKEPTSLQGTPSLYRICTPEEREADRKNTVGLTPFGLEVLKASNELGIVTDMSHINDKAFYDVMERSSTPPVMSHTAVFSLCPHARCMTDDQIKALTKAGGVMGIAFAPGFIDTDPKKATIDRVVEHICYVADLVGIDTVGIGTDYDGLGKTVPVVPEVSQLVHLTRSMLAHGLSEKEIQKVWGGNFLRVFQQTIDRPASKR